MPADKEMRSEELANGLRGLAGQGRKGRLEILGQELKLLSTGRISFCFARKAFSGLDEAHPHYRGYPPLLKSFDLDGKHIYRTPQLVFD